MKGKQKKKNKILIPSLIAVVVLLAILSAVSVTYNFLGGFYYCRVLKFDKMLGEEQTISVTGEGAFVCACNFSGSLVSDGNVKQQINVTVDGTSNQLYLRAKFAINGVDADGQYMFGAINWVQADDGYLYLNQPLRANQSAMLCNQIKINSQDQLRSNIDYIMYFVVESSETIWEYVSI